MDDTREELNAANVEFRGAKLEVKSLYEEIKNLPLGHDRDAKLVLLAHCESNRDFYEREVIRLEGKLKEAQAPQQGI